MITRLEIQRSLLRYEIRFFCCFWVAENLFLKVWQNFKIFTLILNAGLFYVWRFGARYFNQGDVTFDDSKRQLLLNHSVTTFLWHCFKWQQHYSNIATLCCAKNCHCKSSRVTSPLYPQNKLTLAKDKRGGSRCIFPGISLASDCLILLVEKVRT